MMLKLLGLRVYLRKSQSELRLLQHLQLQQMTHPLPHQRFILAVEHPLVHTQQPRGMEEAVS